MIVFIEKVVLTRIGVLKKGAILCVPSAKWYRVSSIVPIMYPLAVKG
jgi:hypothetical protein